MIQEKYLDTVPEYIVWSRFNCFKLLCTIACTGIKAIASLEPTQIVWQTFLDEAHKYCVMVLAYFNLNGLCWGVNCITCLCQWKGVVLSHYKHFLSWCTKLDGTYHEFWSPNPNISCNKYVILLYLNDFLGYCYTISIIFYSSLGLKRWPPEILFNLQQLTSCRTLTSKSSTRLPKL